MSENLSPSRALTSNFSSPPSVRLRADEEDRHLVLLVEGVPGRLGKG